MYTIVIDCVSVKELNAIQATLGLDPFNHSFESSEEANEMAFQCKAVAPRAFIEICRVGAC